MDTHELLRSVAKRLNRLGSDGDTAESIEDLYQRTARHTLARIVLGDSISDAEAEENDGYLKEYVGLIARNGIDPEEIAVGIVVHAATLLNQVFKTDTDISEMQPCPEFAPWTRGNTIDRQIGMHEATVDARKRIGATDMTVFAYPAKMYRYPADDVVTSTQVVETPDSVTQYQELQREIALITGGSGGVVDLSMAGGLPGMITRSLELRKEIGNRVANYAQDQVFSDLRAGL